MKKFDNYVSNLKVLSLAEKENLNNEFIISGIIDKFSIQFELAWKVLKELLKVEGRGEANTGSPRMIIKTANTVWDFINEEVWISMLKDRNDMSHIYDGEAAKRLAKKIIDIYIPEFINIQEQVIALFGDELKSI